MVLDWRRFMNLVVLVEVPISGLSLIQTDFAWVVAA